MVLIIRVISIFTVHLRKCLSFDYTMRYVCPCSSPPSLLAPARDEWRQREVQINVDKSGQIYIVALERRWERESRPFCITRVDKTRFRCRVGWMVGASGKRAIAFDAWQNAGVCQKNRPLYDIAVICVFSHATAICRSLLAYRQTVEDCTLSVQIMPRQ